MITRSVDVSVLHRKWLNESQKILLRLTLHVSVWLVMTRTYNTTRSNLFTVAYSAATTTTRTSVHSAMHRHDTARIPLRMILSQAVLTTSLKRNSNLLFSQSRAQQQRHQLYHEDKTTSSSSTELNLAASSLFVLTSPFIGAAAMSAISGGIFSGGLHAIAGTYYCTYNK
jgi:hypothetical protein